jgi:hypothetical protein
MSGESNPYESPASPVELRSRQGSLTRSIFAVIFAGIVVDFLGSHFVLIPFVAIGMIVIGPDATRDWLNTETASYYLKAIGVLISGVGGATAAFIARRKPIRHALLSAAVANIAMLPSWIARDKHLELLGWVTLLLSFVAAGMAGHLFANGVSRSRPDKLPA